MRSEWGAERCVYANNLYETNERLNGLAIGDNTGGDILIYLPDSKAGPEGLYMVDCAILSLSDCRFVAESLTAILVRGHGLDRIRF